MTPQALATLARTALAAYALDVTDLTRIPEGWNCNFRVETTAGERFVLRVSPPDRRRDEEIDAELAWLTTLGAEPDIHVPRPVPARDGSLVVRASAPGVPEPRRCALFSWIPGVHLAEAFTDVNMAAFGDAVARLHAQALRYPIPHALTVWDRAFAFPEPVVIFDEFHAEMVPPQARATFERAWTAADDAIARLVASGEPPRIAHGDLHEENVFVDGHQVWLLDFDDCQVAWPVQDIGVTFFEIGEEEERLPARRRAFREGYERVAPWPERYPGEIDVFAANRGLLRINYLLQPHDPDDRASLDGVLEYARVIDAFLDGRFAGS